MLPMPPTRSQIQMVTVCQMLKSIKSPTPLVQPTSPIRLTPILMEISCQMVGRPVTESTPVMEAMVMMTPTMMDLTRMEMAMYVYLNSMDLRVFTRFQSTCTKK